MRECIRLDARVPIQRTIDYIEENLHDEIATEKLAGIASLSLFHYQRLFARLVNKPVQEYIQMRRVARASKGRDMKTGRYLESGHDFAFGSHESFTAAFKDAYGFTLAEFRGNPALRDKLKKPDLLQGGMAVDEGIPLAVDGMVLEICRRTLEAPIKFIGASCYSCIDSLMPARIVKNVGDQCTIWGRFNQEWQCVEGKLKGLASEAPHNGETAEVFFTNDALEATYNHSGDVQSWQLPLGDYAVCGFEVESFDELVTVSIHKAGKFALSWLEKHGLACDGFTAEIYYGNISDAAYMETWYPIAYAEPELEQDILPYGL